MKKLKKSISFAFVVLLATLLVGCSLKNNSQETNMKNNIPATIETSKGDIEIELFAQKAPEMVKNFVTLAEQSKYDDVIFHRVIKDFMIQTGDYENGNGTGGASYTGKDLADEIDPSLSHTRGILSMANRGPNTNGSQFFIVQEDSTYLDGNYSIFGKVTKGMDIVDEIASVETDATDRPLQDIKIKTIKIKK